MIAAVQKFLESMGYNLNGIQKARKVIGACDDWYRARITDKHQCVTVNGQSYQLERMGFGQRAAADDANLCEVVEINAGGENQAQYEFVRALLEENQFDVQYRKQLEMTSAEGTSACYVRLEDAQTYTDGSLRGGRIRLNYVDALGFLPLTVDNDDVTEAAFFGTELVASKERTTLVLCTKDDSGRYHYTVRVYDEDGEELIDLRQDAVLGEIKPFAVLRTACVNPIPDMRGFGYPKLYGVIPVLRGLDAAYTALMGDIDTAEKITLINEALCKFDDNGNPITPNQQMKRRFVLLGEKLPEQNDLVHEITPEIRVEKFRDTIELLLNLLSQQFGYGTKRYSFDQETGALMTATQYVGERQDMLQELNRQRYAAKEYIVGIVRAAMWFANAYQGSAWNTDADIQVEFDDSYITNKADELAEMRNDILAGIGGAYVRRLYLMERYNLTEAEAAKWAAADTDAASAGDEPED